MFSKPIFKQTLKANFKLWLIFTAVMCVLSTVIIAVFDQKMISGMMEMMQDTPFASMMSEEIGNMASILGMLSQSFYTMQGILLPLIFIIMTANSLIASQVDRGSMAYLLSTPTKRSTVVRTQALYLITAIFCMFVVVTGTGLSAVQIFQGGVVGQTYTEDVKKAAKVLNIDRKALADDLNLILKNEEARKAGAEARGLDEEIYTGYLNMKIANEAYQAAGDVLHVDVSEVKKDLTKIRGNEEALAAAAKVIGVDKQIYAAALETTIAQQAAMAAQSTEMQNKMVAGLTAAAKVLDMDVSDLAAKMEKIKENNDAMNAFLRASELPRETVETIINQQLIENEIALDEGIVFSVKDYLMLNFGAFLLMFAISSISFLFSCIFNLSKNSLALGAGLPVAFFIFQIMAQVGDSLKGFRYVSLNTLFDTAAITTGGSYWVQFVVLGAIGVVLYMVGMKCFKEKDLPL